MSAVADINARHLQTFERLLAASTTIIQLERTLAAAEAMINMKQDQVEGLRAVADGCISMLEVARPLFPDDLLEQLDTLLIKSRKLLTMVKP